MIWEIELNYNTLLIKKLGGVATIVLNRPEQLNAVNMEMLKELREVLRMLESDAEVKAVVITGAGPKAFCAGADLKGGIFSPETDASQGEGLSETGQQVCDAIENLGKPVIAAVNGLALGGGFELAMACDIMIAAEEAKFGSPEINLGLIPGWGGTQRLPRLVGTNRAKELILGGKIIDAMEAERIGIVNKTIPTERFQGTVAEFAQLLAEKSPIMLRLAKKAINQMHETDLKQGLAEERSLFRSCFDTRDYKEGVEAFLSKRKPRFTGK